MNAALKLLTDETRAKILSSVVSESVTKLIASTKAASDADTGTFKVIISTADIDRQGESISQEGWDLNFFKNNPVVLWAHDYEALPIGMCTKIDMIEGKLIAEGKFAPAEANPFAQQIRKLYELGMVNTTSVGFIPKEFDPNVQGRIMKQELLEFSFVPVPANPYALRLDQMKSFDLPLLKTKGIEFVEKKEEKTKGIEISKAIEILKSDTDMEHDRHSKGMLDHIEKCYKAMTDGKKTAEEKAIEIDKAIEILKSDTTLEHEMHSKTMHANIEKCYKSMDEDGEEGEEKMLSKIQAEAFIKSTITNLIALGTLKVADGDKNGKGDTAVTGSKSLEAITELNGFLETRSLLRQMDNSLEKVLRLYNLAAKAESRAK